tara:strand:+ start:3481 stop:3642 length:162 start_codon:yes stop_codon:yes gene_type:complete
MRGLVILWVLIIVGCSVFNPGDNYNPDYTPKPIIEEVKIDTVKSDTIKIIIIE